MLRSIEVASRCRRYRNMLLLSRSQSFDNQRASLSVVELWYIGFQDFRECILLHHKHCFVEMLFDESVTC